MVGGVGYLWSHVLSWGKVGYRGKVSQGSWVGYSGVGYTPTRDMRQEILYPLLLEGTRGTLPPREQKHTSENITSLADGKNYKSINVNHSKLNKWISEGRSPNAVYNKYRCHIR